jgi:hypothetical protein
MCSCKNTPLQKVEARIASRGWNYIANSELKLIDEFIFQKINDRPANMEQRIEMYGNAKSR